MRSLLARISALLVMGINSCGAVSSSVFDSPDASSRLVAVILEFYLEETKKI